MIFMVDHEKTDAVCLIEEHITTGEDFLFVFPKSCEFESKWRSLYQNALALQSSPKHACSARYFPPELTLCYVHEKW